MLDLLLTNIFMQIEDIFPLNSLRLYTIMLYVCLISKKMLGKAHFQVTFLFVLGFVLGINIDVVKNETCYMLSKMKHLSLRSCKNLTANHLY